MALRKKWGNLLNLHQTEGELKKGRVPSEKGLPTVKETMHIQ